MVRGGSTIPSQDRSQQYPERKLDISRTCQDELETLRQSDDFKVQFPTLTESEFIEHCIHTDIGIKCELNGTSLVDDFRTICNDAGGKLVVMDVIASGACVDFVNVTFYDFPLCAGMSCDESNFIESYEEKLKLERSLVGGDCVLDLASGGSLPKSTHLITIMSISLVVLGMII